MSSENVDKPVIDPADAAVLSRQGLLVTYGGNVKIHRRRTHRSSDKEYSDHSLEGTAAGLRSAYLEIPAKIISKETLTYVGFNSSAASRLWQQWTHWPATGPRRETDHVRPGTPVTKFSDFIVGHIGITNAKPDDTASAADSEWVSCMRHYGLNTETMMAILEKAFRHVRMNETCAFWARDTISMRFAGIVEMRVASLGRAATIGNPGESSSAAAPGAHQDFSAGAGPSASVSSSASTSTGIAIELATRNAPGFTTLYKGLDAARLNGLFAEDGSVRDFSVLASNPPGDFSGNARMYYFTPQFEVAANYAGYAKRRSKCEAVVIVAMAVPNSAIEALQPPEIGRLFWPNPEWATMVWASRTRATLPKQVAHLNKAMLLIGHIAAHPECVYYNMESAAEVTEKHILIENGREGGEKAVQYVFRDDAGGRAWLLANGGRTVVAFPFTSRDMEGAIKAAMSRGRQ